MKNRLLIIFLLVASAGFSQVNFDLYSAMDGQLQLSPFGSTNFWGYGFMDEPMTLPAPLLTAQKGDSVHLAFTNFSQEGHTIHLHGLDVDQANDGVPQTSFTVYTGQTGEYSFKASHEGTFLYHCHVTTTLHLTMGMYGMFVVEAGENQLFEGGPVYDRSYEFLMSDLERETNDNPAMAFPFHEIQPDYFMVNGRSGEDLQSTGTTVGALPNEKIALRLGSMAYSLVKVHFPENLNAEVMMSDGRVLENAFSPEILEIYPGERFSVLLEPEGSFTGEIEVEYYSMMNGEYEFSNFIPVQDLTTGVGEMTKNNQLRLQPNPAVDQVAVKGAEGVDLSINSIEGRSLGKVTVPLSGEIDISHLQSGVYILRAGNGLSTRLVVR
ncbi:multicopper oxidase domain-containing protein [Halocola ammonii]